jgi:hypothetical protein
MVKSRKSKRGGNPPRKLDGIEVSLLAIMQKKVVERQRKLIDNAVNMETDPSIPSGSYTTYYDNDTKIEKYKCFMNQVLGINNTRDRRFIIMLLTYTVRISNKAITISTYSKNEEYNINTRLNKPDDIELLLGKIDSMLKDFKIEPFQVMKWFEIRIYAMLLSVIAKFLEIDRNVKDGKKSYTDNFDPETFFGTSLYDILLSKDHYTKDWNQMETAADKLIDKSLNAFARIVEKDLMGVIDTNKSLVYNYEQFEILFTKHIKSGILYKDLTESHPTFPIDLFRVIPSTIAGVSPVYIVSFVNNEGKQTTFNNYYNWRNTTQEHTDLLFFENLIQTINASTLSIGNGELPRIGDSEKLSLTNGEEPYGSKNPDENTPFFTSFDRKSPLNRAAACIGDACKLGPNAKRVVNTVSSCVGDACRKYDRMVQENPKWASLALLTTGAAAGVTAKNYFGFGGGAKSRKRRKSKTRKQNKTKKLRPKTNRRRRKSRL